MSGKEKHGLTSWTSRRVRRAAADAAPKDARRILDAACGRGDLFEETGRLFPNATWTGLDRDRNLLDAMSGRCTAVEGDIFEPPAFAEPFDLIFLLNVTYNLGGAENAARAVAALLPLLGPGGVLVADIRNAANPLLRMRYWLSRRLGRYTPNAVRLGAIRAAVGRVGGSVRRATPLGRPIPFAYLLEITNAGASE